jgi:hypothetical protein
LRRQRTCSRSSLLAHTARFCRPSPRSQSAALTAGSIAEADPEIGDELTVTGSNATGTATFQWQQSADGSTSWANISGATSATLDTSTGVTDDYYVRRGVSDGAQGPVYTAAVQVDAAAAPTGPEVSGTTGSPTITTSFDNDGTIGTLYDFAADGTITFSAGGVVEYAMVGGGAPGGMTGGTLRAGGGGAGGKVLQGTTTVSAAALSVVVAAQTNMATDPTSDPRQAPSSSFNSIVAPGGWEGGHFVGGVGDPGGSGADGHGGGAAGGSSAAGGTGDVGYNSGGDGANTNEAGGGAGDGGDGAPGVADPAGPGAGGAGTTIDLTGATWGAGGSGWSQSQTPTAAAGTNPGDGGDGTNSTNLVGHGAAGRVLIFVPD